MWLRTNSNNTNSQAIMIYSSFFFLIFYCFSVNFLFFFVFVFLSAISVIFQLRIGKSTFCVCVCVFVLIGWILNARKKKHRSKCILISQFFFHFSVTEFVHVEIYVIETDLSVCVWLRIRRSRSVEEKKKKLEWRRIVQINSQHHSFRMNKSRYKNIWIVCV